MHYIGLNTCDTANGPGLRVSLFVSGCRLHCKGCFNEESWAFDAGRVFDETTVERLMTALSEPFVAGLSILGGDPLEPENEPVVEDLCRRVKARFGNEKTIWLWTGRTFEKVADKPLWAYVDTVVDGPFVLAKRVTEQGCWFGSTNQRVIKLVSGRPHFENRSAE